MEQTGNGKLPYTEKMEKILKNTELGKLEVLKIKDWCRDISGSAWKQISQVSSALNQPD